MLGSIVYEFFLRQLSLQTKSLSSYPDPQTVMVHLWKMLFFMLYSGFQSRSHLGRLRLWAGCFPVSATAPEGLIFYWTF